MLLISQLAKAARIPAHTIRYYEQYGLITSHKDPAVTTNKYSYYDEDTVGRLLLIQDAKAIGFTLAEIKELLDGWYNRTLPPAQKLAVLDRKLEEIEQKIAHLHQMKTYIQAAKTEVEAGLC